jgi:nanoRNase/pAp phosphatase (c-di-AMP/oligoRNAs hydrolase)
MCSTITPKFSAQKPAPKIIMQVDPYIKTQFNELVEQAQNIAIIPSKTAGSDSFCAGVGLYQMLKEKYDGDYKNIKLVHFGKIPQHCEHLINPEEIESNLSQRDLLISVNYANTPAAKVAYSTENETLLLKLGPVPKDFDTDRVKTRIVGFDFDVIITIGTPDMYDLGPIYSNLKDEFDRAHIVNIDNNSNNKRFGIVNIIDSHADTLSTLIFKKASEWEMIPNKNAAQALLVGMTYRENGAR